MWVDVRNNLKRYGITMETDPANTDSGTPAQPLQLCVPHHARYLEHRNVLRQVRQHMKLLRWKAWCAHKDQGKTARAHGGLSSGFLTRPRNMWECDYRFAIAALLNMLDTSDVLSRRRLRAHACRWKESLAHVLNHCPGTMDAIRGRHDDALKVIERSLVKTVDGRQGRTELRVNQTVPGMAGLDLRPDLQVYNNDTRTVAVVDLAIAFDQQDGDESSCSGLVEAAVNKTTKYAGIKRHLERQGWKYTSRLLFTALWARWRVNGTSGSAHEGRKAAGRQLSTACIQSSRRI
ncbi:unnamed protein product [Peronospora belbahrii]|uniref:Reverse transcriptase n=1 Tax=Peronospora belbahrii TaxID=622444 RepID=A0ABN8CZT8_9STRA|nr:unnamed protein product [Peronospora belbahrii]